MLFVHLTIELHVGADPVDVLGGKSPAPISDCEDELVARFGRCHRHWSARLRKLESVLHHFIHDLGEILLRNGSRMIGQVEY